MDKCTKYINLFLFSLFQSCTQHFYHGRQYGNHNNGHNQQFEVLLYKRKVTEEITRITEDGNPAGAPNQVVQHEVIVMHLTHPRHEWRKRTDDRHKTGYDNCLASILLIELMGLVEMALLEYSGIGIIEEPLPEEMPYHVVARVAQYRGNKQYQSQHIDLERHVRQCGNSSRHKKQGIARQERCDHQPRFAENNQKQYGIRPHMIFLHYINHILIDMENKI